jgi:hypothetical protein
MISKKNDLTMYVYYRISANTRPLCLSAVKNLDQSIKSFYPHLKIQYQKRPNLDAEHKETWMEIHTGISSSELEKFSADLSELAEKYGLPKNRKYEVFVGLGSD